MNTNITIERIDKLEAIAEQAKETRRLQRVYFQLRTPGALKESKAAETLLDRMLQRLDNPKTELFDK